MSVGSDRSTTGGPAIPYHHKPPLEITTGAALTEAVMAMQRWDDPFPDLHIVVDARLINDVGKAMNLVERTAKNYKVASRGGGWASLLILATLNPIAIGGVWISSLVAASKTNTDLRAALNLPHGQDAATLVGAGYRIKSNTRNRLELTRTGERGKVG